MTFFASSLLFTSSRLLTRMSTSSGWSFTVDKISSFCEGSRITLVTCHDRDTRSGVRRRDTFPCPPRSSTLFTAIAHEFCSLDFLISLSYGNLSSSLFQSMVCNLSFTSQWRVSPAYDVCKDLNPLVLAMSLTTLACIVCVQCRILFE